MTHTLIRCYFSPAFTTGQKYIITGSSNGSIQSLFLSKDLFFVYYFLCLRLVYDVLTGEIRLTLSSTNNPEANREKCIRDISWHPYENYIISTSVNSFESCSSFSFFGA